MGDGRTCSAPAPQSQPVASAPRLATLITPSVASGLKMRVLAAGPAHSFTLLLSRRLCERLLKLNIPRLRFSAMVIGDRVDVLHDSSIQSDRDAQVALCDTRPDAASSSREDQQPDHVRHDPRLAPAPQMSAGARARRSVRS